MKQWRGTQRYLPIQRVDEDALTRDIITLASQYGRYATKDHGAVADRRLAGGERSSAAHLASRRAEANKQRARRRLWLNDGSCVRLRPARANHVWSYDFVSAMTHDGRTIRMLTMIDEYTRECLAIRVARRLGSYEVIEALADVMLGEAFQRTFGLTTARSLWPRNCGSGWRTWDRYAVHRTGQSLGERLLRELQWEAAR